MYRYKELSPKIESYKLCPKKFFCEEVQVFLLRVFVLTPCTDGSRGLKANWLKLIKSGNQFLTDELKKISFLRLLFQKEQR